MESQGILEYLKLVVGTGVGGALAVVMFYFYRKDFIEERADRAGREQRLMEVAERAAVSTERHAAVAEQLSARVVELCELIRRWDVERFKEFSTLLHAITDSAPRPPVRGPERDH